MGQYEQAAHIRRVKRRKRIEAMRGRMRRNALVSVTMLVVSASALAVGVRETGCAHADDGCAPAMVMPVKGGIVASAFDGPAQVWLAGHRGIDIEAQEGTTLVAPVDGSISFSGKVAGKSVVSIVHGAWTLTFEPAVTSLVVGSRVRRGEPFGTVSGTIDHCDGTCVHWGMRAAGRMYVDPERWLHAQRVMLVE